MILWLRLQLRLLPYKLAWLMVVAFSIVYSLRGMQAIFPGENLFLFRGSWVTETHLLGIALCLGQYTSLSISFNLMRDYKVLRFPDKLMAVGGLIIGICLTVSNTTFAFKAINLNKDGDTVKIETLKTEVQSLQYQIATTKDEINQYNERLSLIPSAHSSNIRKMFEEIQKYTQPLQQHVGELQTQIYKKQAEITHMEESLTTNRNFTLSGMDGSRLIAMVMSIALDPIAILIMLSMQSLTARYWDQVKTTPSRLKLAGSKPKRPLSDRFSEVKHSLTSQKVVPIRKAEDLREVEIVDHIPQQNEDEVDIVVLKVP